MQTTLNKIKKYEPCLGGWKNLLRSLNKTEADDEALSITQIIDSNGLDDALWCLRAVNGYDREIRLYAVWCARKVQHLMRDARSVTALDVSERYAQGDVTEEEMDAAIDVARAAARAAEDASMAARDGTGEADWAAFWAAAMAPRDAAEYAVTAAARGATMGAPWSAAGNATWASVRAEQEKELRRICAATTQEQGEACS